MNLIDVQALYKIYRSIRMTPIVGSHVDYVVLTVRDMHMERWHRTVSISLLRTPLEVWGFGEEFCHEAN